MRVRADVAAALAAQQPVVALESTLVTHGLPRPRNLTVAREVEAAVTAEGVVPATIGVVAGEAVVGLEADELEHLAAHDVAKLGVRDLAVAVARRDWGATTVASTAVLAAKAGIRLFATGGLGGVHRQAQDSWDVSADLVTLAATPITVVCAGVKSILDVAATLEVLETLNVTVIGFGSRYFPGFYLSSSGHPVPWTVDTAEQVVDVMAAQAEVLSHPGAVVVANPLPPEQQLDPAEHDRVLDEGLRRLAVAGVAGKDVTPFLLAHFHDATGGASLAVNERIIGNNARLAARIARAWTTRR